MSEPLPSDAKDVLDFWFGAPGDARHGQEHAEWFKKNQAFDTQIRERFAALIERALRGEFADWTSTHAALAFVVLLDQFTRNAFRGTPRAFAGDALALQRAQDMVMAGQDLELPPVQRCFVYLPYEHAEVLRLQEQSVRLFKALDADHPTQRDYAERHHAIITRFGRFPHRNAILGRPSTPEEIEFLKQPGSGF